MPPLLYAPLLPPAPAAGPRPGSLGCEGLPVLLLLRTAEPSGTVGIGLVPGGIIRGMPGGRILTNSGPTGAVLGRAFGGAFGMTAKLRLADTQALRTGR